MKGNDYMTGWRWRKTGKLQNIEWSEYMRLEEKLGNWRELKKRERERERELKVKKELKVKRELRVERNGKKIKKINWIYAVRKIEGIDKSEAIEAQSQWLKWQSSSLRIVRRKIEGAGDGRMSTDYQVPVCQTPKGYRVPGLLGMTRARKPVG